MFPMLCMRKIFQQVAIRSHMLSNCTNKLRAGRVHQENKQFKRRRLRLKNERGGDQESAEVCEGTTYSTGCDMSARPLDDSTTVTIPPYKEEPSF